MRYEKPELTQLGSAVVAIQSGGKPTGSPDHSDEPTVNAYEADE
jgi:hypothetical protein